MLVISYDEMLTRIPIMRDPALNAADRARWGGNIEFLGASKLFNVNILVCGYYWNARNQYTWQRYVPSVDKDRHNWEQERAFPTITIYYDDGAGHYQIIVRPEP